MSDYFKWLVRLGLYDQAMFIYGRAHLQYKNENNHYLLTEFYRINLPVYVRQLGDRK